MAEPIVSIITPAYNCVSTIKETYESIKTQTFSSWEWVVVEDHSTDESYEFIKEMVKNDKRVVLLRTEKNGGAAVARNMGIEYAKGRFVAFLDADDLFKKDKLEKQIRFMEQNKYSFTFTDYDLLYPNGKQKKHLIKHDLLTYKMLLKSNFIGCLTVIYDTKAIGKAYMPLDCEKREDHGAWIDITKKGINATKLAEPLSIYRLGERTVSSNKFRMIKYQYRLYRKHEKFGVIKSCWYVLTCSFYKLFKKY